MIVLEVALRDIDYKQFEYEQAGCVLCGRLFEDVMSHLYSDHLQLTQADLELYYYRQRRLTEHYGDD